jgi:hypothetical protein
MLRELGVPVYRKGFRQLVVAIYLFQQDDEQSLTKELYPGVAKIIGGKDWRRVERDIRTVVRCAWETRDADIWNLYFPGLNRNPSNKAFIATLTEYLQYTSRFDGENIHNEPPLYHSHPIIQAVSQVGL